VISALSNDSVAGTLNVTELILGRCAPDQPGEYNIAGSKTVRMPKADMAPSPIVTSQFFFE